MSKLTDLRAEKTGIQNRIIDIAFRLDELPFPPSKKDTENWEGELFALNIELMRWLSVEDRISEIIDKGNI